MTKRNEFNTVTNNSSALVTPARSEIRIEIPTISISIPSRKKILNGLLTVAKKLVHPAAISSAALLSGISLLEVHPSLFVLIPLTVVCAVSATASSLIIYKEVLGE